MSSADVDTVDVGAITDALQDFRSHLESRSKPGRQLATIQAAAKSARALWSDDEIDAIADEHGYATMVKVAAERGCAAYDRLVPHLLDIYRRRLRFEPRFEPELLPAPSGPRGQWTLEAIRNHFGCPQAGYTLRLLHEWDAYCAYWKTAAMTSSMKNMSCSAFWSLASMKLKFPSLSLLGQWWGLVSISNVTVERLFGKMRARDGPLQRTMSLATLKATLSAVHNRVFVDDAIAALSK